MNPIAYTIHGDITRSILNDRVIRSTSIGPITRTTTPSSISILMARPVRNRNRGAIAASWMVIQGGSKAQVRRANKDYTDAVNQLASHPNVTVKATVKGISFSAKAGDVAKGLADAKVDTAPASSTARAQTQGGGLFATSDYFLNSTPAITIYKNAVTSDRHGGAAHIDRDLRRTFAH